MTYVDSSGVGQLVGALTTARNQAADIKLLKPSAHVLDLLKTTKLYGVFDIQEDETAAIQSFSRGCRSNFVISVLPCCPIPGAKNLPPSLRRRD